MTAKTLSDLEGGLFPAPTIRAWSEPVHHEERCEVAGQYERQLETATSGDTINDIKGTVNRLRGVRNARNTPAARRLPTELLVKIVIDVSDISDPRSSRSLIALTHVCRAWRTVALDVPEPWSNIVVTSLSRDGVYSFVDRSRDSLLNIRLQAGRSLVDFRLLADFQFRLRSLIVVAENLEVVAQAVKQLSWKSSPHLEALCLLGPAADGVSGGGRNLVFDTLPVSGEDEPRPLASLTPSLRSLHIRPMVFPWTSGIYTNLSILDIDTTRHSTLTEGRLLSILRRSPELVELRLRARGSLAAFSVSPRDGPWDIALPLLSVFSVDGLSPELVASILSKLTLPAFTRFNLALCSTGRAGSVIAALPLDRTRLPGLATIKALKFDVIGDGNTHITLYPSGAPPIAVVVTDETHSTTIPCVPTAALDSLESITSIGAPSTFIPDWHALFCRLPQLRVLRFERPAIEDVTRTIDGLGMSASGMDGSHEITLPCPQLERVELVDVAFTPEMVDRIAHVVRQRVEGGFATRSLEIHLGTGASASSVPRLRELGVNVVEVTTFSML